MVRAFGFCSSSIRCVEAVLLVAGDKEGEWKSWYDENIPLAEDRYAKWLAGDYANDSADGKGERDA